MSAEISLNANIQVRNGSFLLPRIGAGVVNINQAGAGGGGPGNVVVNDATHVIVSVANLTKAGWCYMRNLHATAEVRFGTQDGSSAFQPCGRMKGGEPALFRIDPGQALCLKADSATVPSGYTNSKVQVVIVED